MAQIVDEIKELYLLYPSWLVTLCLIVVGFGVGFILWKLLRFSLVVIVAILILGIVAFAGYMFLSS